MSSKKYNCSLCLYKTDKKYNFNRHMVLKHKISDCRNDTDNIRNDTCDIINDYSNTTNDTINIINDTCNIININNDTDFINNDTNDKECIKCGKILSSKNYLQKHLIICKGVSNPLECHLCHKILANRGSKSRHLKTCPSNKRLVVYNKPLNEISSEPQIETLSELIPKTNELSISNISNSNNNISNCNNTITTTTYNINLVSYDEYEEKINFDISHLNKEIAHKLSTKYFESAFYYFCMKLFENKNNQLIIKENLKFSNSKIHTGFKVWIKIYDKHIYPIIMTNISETMLLFIETYKLKSLSMKSLIEYLDSMASKNGYYATNTLEYRQNYNIHINQLKILFNKFIEKEDI